VSQTPASSRSESEPSPVGSWSRSLAGVVALGVAVVVAALAVPVVTVGGAGVPVAAACAGAAEAQGMIRVPVVIDPGTVPGAPGGPETLCVTVREGASGSEVLAERARVLGRPAPRYAASGLLCAIDGYPASGCGERVDGQYRYWAYHLGQGGQWNYSPVGPATRRASADELEGWRFTAGSGRPGDPPPRHPATVTSVCAPSPPPPPPAPASPAPTVAAPSPVSPGAPPTDPGPGAPPAPPVASGSPSGPLEVAGLGPGSPGDRDPDGGRDGDEASTGQVAQEDQDGSLAGGGGGDDAGGDAGGDAVAGPTGTALDTTGSSTRAGLGVGLAGAGVAAGAVAAVLRSRRRTQLLPLTGPDGDHQP
jgi:hypothetical protein